MILLDTNVISALMREKPDGTAEAWLDRQPRIAVWTSAISVLEIRLGLQIMAAGRRRDIMAQDFERLMQNLLANRVAHFDQAAAEHTATLMADRRKIGRTVDLRDSMIAGIALSLGATIATRNVRHFEGLSCPVVNPWA